MDLFDAQNDRDENLTNKLKYLNVKFYYPKNTHMSADNANCAINRVKKHSTSVSLVIHLKYKVN